MIKKLAFALGMSSILGNGGDVCAHFRENLADETRRHIGVKRALPTQKDNADLKFKGLTSLKLNDSKTNKSPSRVQKGMQNKGETGALVSPRRNLSNGQKQEKRFSRAEIRSTLKDLRRRTFLDLITSGVKPRKARKLAKKIVHLRRKRLKLETALQRFQSRRSIYLKRIASLKKIEQSLLEKSQVKKPIIQKQVNVLIPKPRSDLKRGPLKITSLKNKKIEAEIVLPKKTTHLRKIGSSELTQRRLNTPIKDDRQNQPSKLQVKATLLHQRRERAKSKQNSVENLKPKSLPYQKDNRNKVNKQERKASPRLLINQKTTAKKSNQTDPILENKLNHSNESRLFHKQEPYLKKVFKPHLAKRNQEGAVSHEIQKQNQMTNPVKEVETKKDVKITNNHTYGRHQIKNEVFRNLNEPQYKESQKATLPSEESDENILQTNSAIPNDETLNEVKSGLDATQTQPSSEKSQNDERESGLKVSETKLETPTDETLNEAKHEFGDTPVQLHPEGTATDEQNSLIKVSKPVNAVEIQENAEIMSTQYDDENNHNTRPALIENFPDIDIGLQDAKFESISGPLNDLEVQIALLQSQEDTLPPEDKLDELLTLSKEIEENLINLEAEFDDDQYTNGKLLDQQRVRALHLREVLTEANLQLAVLKSLLTVSKENPAILEAPDDYDFVQRTASLKEEIHRIGYQIMGQKMNLFGTGPIEIDQIETNVGKIEEDMKALKPSFDLFQQDIEYNKNTDLNLLFKTAGMLEGLQDLYREVNNSLEQTHEQILFKKNKEVVPTPILPDTTTHKLLENKEEITKTPFDQKPMEPAAIPSIEDRQGQSQMVEKNNEEKEVTKPDPTPTPSQSKEEESSTQNLDGLLSSELTEPQPPTQEDTVKNELSPVLQTQSETTEESISTENITSETKTVDDNTLNQTQEEVNSVTSELKNEGTSPDEKSSGQDKKELDKEGGSETNVTPQQISNAPETQAQSHETISKPSKETAKTSLKFSKMESRIPITKVRHKVIDLYAPLKSLRGVIGDVNALNLNLGHEYLKESSETQDLMGEIDKNIEKVNHTLMEILSKCNNPQHDKKEYLVIGNQYINFQSNYLENPAPKVHDAKTNLINNIEACLNIKGGILLAAWPEFYIQHFASFEKNVNQLAENYRQLRDILKSNNTKEELTLPTPKQDIITEKSLQVTQFATPLSTQLKRVMGILDQPLPNFITDKKYVASFIKHNIMPTALNLREQLVDLYEALWVESKDNNIIFTQKSQESTATSMKDELGQLDKMLTVLVTPNLDPEKMDYNILDMALGNLGTLGKTLQVNLEKLEKGLNNEAGMIQYLMGNEDWVII